MTIPSHIGKFQDQVKSKLSYSETQKLLGIALNGPFQEARDAVYQALLIGKFTEAEFHDAIEEHMTRLRLTSEQWLRIFQMYSSPIFRSRFEVAKLLSEKDINKLTENDGILKP